MPEINWDDEDEAILPAATYLVEVSNATLKTSKSGDDYFSIDLVAVDYKRESLGSDILMLGGKGFGIGKAKLKGLGFTKEDRAIEAATLIGRRAYASFKIDEYQSFKRLVVDIGATDSRCGFYLEDDGPPPGLREPSLADVVAEELPLGGNTPF